MQLRQTTDLLTIKQVAEYLECSYQSALRIAQIPGFPLLRTGTRKRYRVRLRDLDAWLSSRPVRQAGAA